MFVFLKSATGEKIINRVARFSVRFGMHGFAVVLFIASLLYFEFPNETHALVDDWAGFTKYFCYFIFGYFIGINPTFILAKDNEVRYAVINGFLIDLSTGKGNFKNGLIYR